MINKENMYDIDLKDEVVRGAIITHQGKTLWPNPNPPMLDAKKKTATKVEKKEVVAACDGSRESSVACVVMPTDIDLRCVKNDHACLPGVV